MQSVSRETQDRLDIFVELFRKWQARINLVSPSTLNELQTRHIADSAQLLMYRPEMRRIADLGSGGGFPGVILAILLSDRPDAHVHLIESNHKKASFLREALRLTDGAGTVHCGRIEAILPTMKDIDTVTARALAPLNQLLSLSAPILGRGAVGLFHKGREYREEVAAARGQWTFDLVVLPSKIDPESVVLSIKGPERREHQQLIAPDAKR